MTVFGDCSKTTGFFKSTPGGPLNKIQRRMVAKGIPTCEVNEAYSTKSSLCCHGAHNRCQRNGQDPITFKKGRYQAAPDNMPREVHGILICQRCGKTWNRDFVGAVNIFDIYIARIRGEPRPARFKRPKGH